MRLSQVDTGTSTTDVALIMCTRHVRPCRAICGTSITAVSNTPSVPLRYQGREYSGGIGTVDLTSSRLVPQSCTSKRMPFARYEAVSEWMKILRMLSI